MNWEQRLVLENVKNLLDQQEILPSEDGEIDFHLLSTLEGLNKGKIGLVAQGLLRVFSENTDSGKPEDRLEELAAILLLWSSQLRLEKQKLSNSVGVNARVGAKVQVRLPDHFPLFIGEVNKEGEIFIPVLQKSYHLDDVQIIPMRSRPENINNPPIAFQEELRKSILEFQKPLGERFTKFSRGEDS